MQDSLSSLCDSVTAHDRRPLEKALQEMEAYGRSIIETANDAFISIDSQGRIIDWNRKAEIMFGWLRAEALGQLLAETIIPPQHREAHLRGLQHFLATGEGPVLNQHIELSALRRDGLEFPVGLTIWATRTKGSWRFNAFVHDISQRKLAEEKIHKLNEELQQRIMETEASNKELQAFSYMVSHDLRSPLRAMGGFSRILLEEYSAQLPEDAQRYLRQVEENALRMDRLINDLLAFSRLSRTLVITEAVSTADLVRSVLKSLSREQEGRQVEVVIGNLPICHADPSLLRQVFFNLISNALKYTRQRARAVIEIGCLEEGADSDQCVFFVKDNGVGFDMAYAEKLFEAFQRLHRAEDYEGTGIGLAIVKRIVQRHGGQVWAEGKVNQGATLFFSISRKGCP